MSVWPEEASQSMVDVVFELDAGTLADDHAEALADALRRALPWLADEPRAGILPLSGLGRGDGRHFVGRRSRLAIRLPHGRRASADLLCGTTLDLDGVPLGIGRCSLRPLLPITEVVYSHFVSFGTADEIEFLAACRAALAEQGIGGTPVTGRARHLNTGAGPVHGFTLMLHSLKRAESMAIQESGLGLHRLLGCGIFMPHKSIAAVGE
ncbi:MAG: type I-MYXAN CRISPR-associated protein Cas6/Cmx6 [Sterolibacteriaceae bacterium]|nr:type I-MYXAN CRISPR-associated protein Cas6/Cmx6 [Sterolibacteriaceae bacterium]